MTPNWPGRIEAIANAAQAAAIVVGGWWTYSLFVRQRQHHARANISHTAASRVIDDSSVLLRIDICVQNVGHVRIAPSRGMTTVYQVLPFGPDMAPYLSQPSAGEIRTDTGYELPWPVLRRHPWKVTDPFWLEPGESDRLYCDVILPRATTSVLVRTLLYCGPEKAGDANWRITTLHDLSATV